MLKHEHRKAGELVTMSAYGRKIQSNPTFLHWSYKREGPDLVGVIVNVDLTAKYPFYVQWINPPDPMYLDNSTMHSVRELKVYRRKKYRVEGL